MNFKLTLLFDDIFDDCITFGVVFAVGFFKVKEGEVQDQNQGDEDQGQTPNQNPTRTG